MAKNQSRSMSADFGQGTIDNTYIQLAPNRGGVENPPLERYTWPRYQHVDQWFDPPFMEAHLRRTVLPHEIKTTGDGDSRF